MNKMDENTRIETIILLIYLRFKVRPFLHISIYFTCSAAAMNHIQIRLSPYSYESMLFIVRHIPTALHHDLYKNVSTFLGNWRISLSKMRHSYNVNLNIKGTFSGSDGFTTTYAISVWLYLNKMCSKVRVNMYV
jgi:hypothetical protein